MERKWKWPLQVLAQNEQLVAALHGGPEWPGSVSINTFRLPSETLPPVTEIVSIHEPHLDSPAGEVVAVNGEAGIRRERAAIRGRRSSLGGVLLHD